MRSFFLNKTTITFSKPFFLLILSCITASVAVNVSAATTYEPSNDLVPGVNEQQSNGVNKDYYFDQNTTHLIARTKKAINWYREIVVNGGWPRLEFTTLLELGVKSDEVTKLAERLYLERDLKGLNCREPVCVYDLQLERAVKRFQKRHGLVVDGKVGKRTLAKLNISATKKLQQLQLNFHRMSNFAGANDEQYVYVNIPEYILRYVKNGTIKLQNKAIVGKPTWKTPAFSDQIEKFVVNPEWRIPTSIATKEIAPKVAKNADYLAKNNIEIRENSYIDSTTVDPDNINWQAIEPYQFEHFLVKRPGEENPLGEVKYLFPNTQAIYVHDTPAKQRFGQTRRALSHGCIRIDKPFSLAREIIKQQGDVAQLSAIDTARATDQTHTFYLEKPIPIHLVYWTAWVDEQMLVNFRDDIYQHDSNLHLNNAADSVFVTAQQRS
jgi:L,D-transpeptidase YcbB